jgi:hypothetical protein
MSDLSDSVAKEIVAYLDGSLDAAQVKELGARLQQDRSLRREAAQLLLQQVQLAEIGQEDKVTGDLPVLEPARESCSRLVAVTLGAAPAQFPSRVDNGSWNCRCIGRPDNARFAVWFRLNV